MAVLKAYSAGVNARLNEINEKALGRGAPELFLFNAEISPWTPADSLAVLKMMAVQLSGHMQSEILRAQTALMISPERLADILPDVPGEGTAALPDYASLFPSPAMIFMTTHCRLLTRPILPVPRTPLLPAPSGRRRAVPCWPMTRILALPRRPFGIWRG
jgi:penicillin amidase